MRKNKIPDGVTADEVMRTIVGAADQNYITMLRFRLVDKEQRTFVAERFCSRGAIDDWIFLGGPDGLKKLVGRYIRLLGGRINSLIHLTFKVCCFMVDKEQCRQGLRPLRNSKTP
ncbi:hypothetical protein K8R14_01295 [bacterium]|nr:hypothetical protein [bacterium]